MNKTLNKIIWVIILIPGIYLFAVWNKLPDSIPVHFNLLGNADRFGNKNELIGLVIGLSLLSLLLYYLLTNIYRIDPKRNAAVNKEKLQRFGFAVAIFLLAITCLVIYSGANNISRFSPGLVFSGIGLLFAFIGNYLPNLKPNYFAGFRLPWTLENPDNWKKTHALAGKLWFGGGLALAIICLFLQPELAIIIFGAVMAVITIIPCVYSYKLFKRQKQIS